MSSSVHHRLRELEDEPRWLQANSILRDRGLLLFDANGAVVVGVEDELVCIVGRPDADTVRRAVALGAPESEVIAQPDAKDRVAEALGCAGEEADIHVLDGADPAVDIDRELAVRVLEHMPDDVPDAELAEELERPFALGHPVSAVVVDDRPVAFCYACSVTDRYWDVSIDTLEAHRRRGYAAQAFLHHYGLMRTLGKEPVWGSVAGNAASRELARKLGFRKESTIWVFELDSVAPPL